MLIGRKATLSLALLLQFSVRMATEAFSLPAQHPRKPYRSTNSRPVGAKRKSPLNIDNTAYEIVRKTVVPSTPPVVSEDLHTLLRAGESFSYPCRLHLFLLASDSANFQTVSAARKAIRRGDVVVNGKQADINTTVAPGDSVDFQSRVIASDNRGTPHTLLNPLRVAYEDDYLAVVVKPPGMIIHGRTVEEDRKAGTEANRSKHGKLNLRAYLPSTLKPSGAGVDVLRRPIHVHRLDEPTGGLVVCAKTRTALAKLTQDFADRKVKKRYRAIVVGELKGDGTIAIPLEGKPSETYYKVCEGNGSTVRSLHSGVLTTVDLWPATGRNHQLRKHLAHLGYPILGDARYHGKVHNTAAGGTRLLEGEGLFLWALGLTFSHPITGEQLEVQIEEPEKFELWRSKEQKRFDKLSTKEEASGIGSAVSSTVPIDEEVGNAITGVQ